MSNIEQKEYPMTKEKTRESGIRYDRIYDGMHAVCDATGLVPEVRQIGRSCVSPPFKRLPPPRQGRWSARVVVHTFVLLLLLVPFKASVAADASVTFDVGGISGLSYGETSLLAAGGVEVGRVVMADRHRDRTQETRQEWYAGDDRTFTDADVEVRNRTFDRDANRLLLEMAWGVIHVHYQPRESGLDMRVEIENATEQTIEYVQLKLLELKFATDVAIGRASTIPGYGYNPANLEVPSIVRARGGEMQALWLSRQPNRHLVQSLTQNGTPNAVTVAMAAGHPEGGVEIYDGVWNARPIPPGEKDVYELSLRFAPVDKSPYDVAADVLRAFGDAYPMTLDWPDRRPIPMIHVADGQTTEKNPRGWKHAIPLPADWDIAAPDSHERFREAALRGARNIADTCRRMGAQGVIVWQIEGQEHNNFAYYGDPQILPYVAPEMDAVADEFFAILRDAGLRVGVTLRPTYHFPTGGDDDTREKSWETFGQSRTGNHGKIPESVSHLYSEESAWCMVSRFDDKIRYAKERWGATLFYVDDNSIWRPRDASAEGKGWSGKLLGAEVFRELQTRHPDVLLVAEHQNFQYYAYTAPYGETPRTTIFAQETTGPDVRTAYPDAFGVLMLHRQANEVRDNLDRYVRAIAAGDVHLPHGWFNDFDRLRSMYHPAAALAPFQIEMRAGEIVLNGGRLESVAALQGRLTALLPESPDFLSRRVFVRYATDVPADVVDAVLGAVAAAGCIVAWTQPSDVDWPAFWRMDNALKPLVDGARAFTIPGRDQSALLVIANATDREREVAVEVSVPALGIGVEDPSTIYIQSLAGLSPMKESPPSRPVLGGGPAGGVDPAGGLEMDRISAEVPLDTENHRFHDGKLEVRVAPFGLRVLRVTRIQP